MESGSASLIDAIKVGLKIEEMDIADLRAAIQSTDNNDVKRVLQHLEQGSMNHLRAFAAQLERLGGTYVPTHLSQSEFSQIAISSAGQRGNQGRGQGRGTRNQPDGTSGSPGPRPGFFGTTQAEAGVIAVGEFDDLDFPFPFFKKTKIGGRRIPLDASCFQNQHVSYPIEPRLAI